MSNAHAGPSEYRRTQVSPQLFMVTAAAIAGIVAAVIQGAVPAVLLVMLGIVALALPVIGILTVSVQDGELAVFFGPGLFRRRFDLRDIAFAQTVYSGRYYGWGVRRVIRTPLMNALGNSAIEIELADGRAYRITSSDPEGLIAALKRAGVRVPG